MFNREMFVTAFTASLDALAQSENVTKRELRALSRTVLEATHETGDIQFVNKLDAILTPVNRKVAILFFKEFTGFTWDDALKMFTKKSKKRYDECHKKYVEFMADPHNSIWSWAERNIEIEPKAFDLGKVTDYVKHALKKAKDNGVTEVQVMHAIIKAGVTADMVIAIMEDVGLEAKVTEEEQPK
jgi:hypothetical protein